MKVLLVCHGYPPTGVAGVERLTAQVAGALTARRHEVTVVTRRPAEPKTFVLERDTREGVPVVTIAGGGNDYENFPAGEPTLERVFERLVVELDPDVVLITHLMHHSPGYVDVAHRWGVPVVLELHDHFAVCPRAHLRRRSGDPCDGPEGGSACARYCFAGQADAELRWALRSKSFTEALRSADEVVAPSRFLAEELAPVRGSGSSPIRVLDNAVTELGPVLREEPAADAPLHLASIGVTTEHKGFHVVVEALRQASIPARYTVLGTALQPAATELREAAEEVPGLELRLFGGFLPTHLPVLLADADAVVVPSLVPETFSIVAREAFACGLPVIASRIGALPEAIRPGEDGWLFEPGEYAELAALLRRIDEDRSLLRGAAARIRSGDLVSVAERTIRVERLLEEVIAGGARGEDAEGAELRLMRDALAEGDAARRPRVPSD